MRSILISTLLAITFQSAHARVFYQREINFAASLLTSKTKTDYPQTLLIHRFSNDYAFCEIEFQEELFECKNERVKVKIGGGDNYYYGERLTLPKGLLDELANAFNLPARFFLDRPGLAFTFNRCYRGEGCVHWRQDRSSFLMRVYLTSDFPGEALHLTFKGSSAESPY
jgi:hypothetical protein